MPLRSLPLIIASCVLLLLSAGVAHGQTTQVTPSREEILQQRQERFKQAQRAKERLERRQANKKKWGSWLRPAAPGEISFPATEVVRRTLREQRHAILELVNAERAKEKLPALTLNPILEAVAQNHAQDMVDRSYVAHKSPEGKNGYDRMKAAGYFTPPCDCSMRYAYGENIAAGYKKADDAVAAWMQSLGHRTNILKPDFRELGVGVVGEVWVQNFGLAEVKTNR